MARPYSIIVIETIPTSTDRPNVIEGRRGRVLDEPSRVRYYASRQTVDVSTGFTMGMQEVVTVGSPANLNATVGVLPSRQDDLLSETFGDTGEEIIIQGSNADAVTARELRVLVDVVAVADIPELVTG